MAEVNVKKVDAAKEQKKSASDITLKALKIAIANKLYISDPEVLEYISDHLARIIAFLQLAPREVSANLVTTLLDMLPHDVAIDIVTRYIERLRRMASKIMPQESGFGGYGKDPVTGILLEMMRNYMLSMTGQRQEKEEEQPKSPMPIPEDIKRVLLGDENKSEGA